MTEVESDSHYLSGTSKFFVDVEFRDRRLTPRRPAVVPRAPPSPPPPQTSIAAQTHLNYRL
ncbi:unnamed protein product [Heligmosomoides polygyrus]|uniref:Uncharacterized protein n=1 Tax=Heligmosomoides polygyrus TaxID=6339 RepID=A0A183FSH2_HELPZ|nr:unnamed protein product [Heligmosomoides polygyrus]